MNTNLSISYTEFWVFLIVGVILVMLCISLLFSILNTKNHAKRIARKQTQRLAESEFRWKFAIEGSGDGVWDWDLKTNQSIYSKRWKEMLGYEESDILSTHQEWQNRIHPEDAQAVDTAIQACINCEIPTYAAEFRLRCKDGNYKWILSRGMVVNYDAEHKPSRMIGTHSDISERKQTEATLQKLYTAIEQSPTSVVITNLEACIEYVNPKFTEITGYEASEVMGKNPRILQSE
ncbi:MAG: PAS domain-containing protein, partial [Sulfurospirillaceae bacterium]|nr:PAS domain-containing protein [Sulfurospirillaceae bacterium]